MNCKELEVRFDKAMDLQGEYEQKISKLRIKERVMSTLKPPRYPYLTKGKDNKPLIDEPWSIYDGIKY